MQTQNYLLDKTEKQKIGNTTFMVSSFLRTGQAPAYLDILNNLLKKELQIEQTKKQADNRS